MNFENGPLGAQCLSRQQAVDLAADLVPQSSDPVWSDTGRTIMCGMIAGLQATVPGTWDWSDLKLITELPPSDLKGFLALYDPEASEHIRLRADGRASSISAAYLAVLRQKTYPQIIARTAGNG